MSTTEEFKEFENPNSASVDRLIQALDRAYHRPGLLMWRAFTSGLFYAIGATVGAAIFFSVVLYVLHVLGGLSLLSPGIEKLSDMITSQQVKSLNKQSDSVTTTDLNNLIEALKASPSATPK